MGDKTKQLVRTLLLQVYQEGINAGISASSEQYVGDGMRFLIEEKKKINSKIDKLFEMIGDKDDQTD